ncbi:MAG: hypothetical protein OIF35_02520, partial [Cellvibrionaceae bacterium]|nr:hypothetical protein [Cellvibrionaceae bacterium]
NRSSFSHRSSSGNYDRLGVQARSIAKAHLNKLGRFMVLDRNDQRSLIAKVRSSGEALSSFRPRYILNGNITAFGSQVPAGNSPYSYRPMFARLGKSKNKDVHAQITINIMDAKTAELVHSTRGAGVYKPSRGRIPYYSGAEGYNVAANGKALGLAIKDALNKLNKDIDAGKLSF